jgi:hypothetical protein
MAPHRRNATYYGRGESTRGGYDRSSGYGGEYMDEPYGWVGARPGRTGGAGHRHGYDRGYGHRDRIWFGGYGGQGEEDAYMRYYRRPRGPGHGYGRDYHGRDRPYAADHGPNVRTYTDSEHAYNYGGYGGFYRRWAPGDRFGRERRGEYGGRGLGRFVGDARP